MHHECTKDAVSSDSSPSCQFLFLLTCVLVAGDRDVLEDALGLGAAEFLVPQVDEDDVVVGAAGHHVPAALPHTLAQRLRVAHNLALVLLKNNEQTL